MNWTDEHELMTDSGELVGTLYRAGWGHWHLLLADGKKVLTTNQCDKDMAMSAIKKQMELRSKYPTQQQGLDAAENFSAGFDNSSEKERSS